MSDQPTPDTDDPAVPDAQLPQADRDKIRDTARVLVDGTLRLDAAAFQALPLRIRRRAWLRYQANFEDRENVRERNARQRAASENQQAVVEVERYAERLRRRRQAASAPPAASPTSAPGMATQHADDSQGT